MNSSINLKNKVIDNGYCIGCGACAYFNNAQVKIKKDDSGKLQAVINDNSISPDVLEVCPFYNSSYNEDVISKELFGNVKKIKHNDYEGYFLENYAGYVVKEDFREKGSSGGFGTWIALKLLEEDLIDAVIHVKPSGKKDLIFEYQVSTKKEEVIFGAKSRYYPIEASKVLQYVKDNDKRYLFIGIPCFVKALRLLQAKDQILKKRIKYTLGLVCGHLKSDFFAKTIAWELGVKPKELIDIDFRVKNSNSFASNYNTRVKRLIDGSIQTYEASMHKLLVANWGHGFFKYHACEYCDDVLAETADITIGDAWLPEYVKDSKGTNIVIVRNNIFEEVFAKYSNEIYLEKISQEKIYESQAGGFRHRREGLSYRLFLKSKAGQWFPKKRVEPSNKIKKSRRKLYELRLENIDDSYKYYKIALEKKDFSALKNHLNKNVKEYDKLYKKNFLIRVFIKIKKILKSFFKK